MLPRIDDETVQIWTAYRQIQVWQHGLALAKAKQNTSAVSSFSVPHESELSKQHVDRFVSALFGLLKPARLTKARTDPADQSA